MTEAEWLISSDPQTMLGLFFKPNALTAPPPSDRKLRLFIAACCRTDGVRVRADYSFLDAVGRLEAAADKEPYASDYVMNSYFPPDWDAKTLAEWASRGVKEAPDFLRCIVGNPFRPVTLWPSRCPRCDSPDPAMQWEGEVQPCHDDWHNHTRCPWLTPQVVSLAEAAYEDRPGRKCDKCGGQGGWLDDSFLGRGFDDCEACHGTGRIEDGRLDPVRLAVLADALEEAGCPTDACEDCGGLRTRAEYTLCVACGGFIKPHPLLAHLRSPGPHVRGCHAVDLCLGKQ